MHRRYSIRQVRSNHRSRCASTGYGARLLKVCAASGAPMLLYQGIFGTGVDCSRLFLAKLFAVCCRDRELLACADSGSGGSGQTMVLLADRY